MPYNPVFSDISLNYYSSVISNAKTNGATGYNASLNDIRWSMHEAGNSVFLADTSIYDRWYITKKFKPSELYSAKEPDKGYDRYFASASDMMRGIYKNSAVRNLVEKQPLLIEPTLKIMEESEKHLKGFYPSDFCHSVFGHLVPMTEHDPAGEVRAYYITEPAALGMQSWNIAMRDTFMRYEINGVKGSNSYKNLYESELKITSYENYFDMLSSMKPYADGYHDHFLKPAPNLLSSPIYSKVAPRAPIQSTQEQIIGAFAATTYARFKFETHADNSKGYKLDKVAMIDLKDVKGRALLLDERDMDQVRAIVNFESLVDVKKKSLMAVPTNKIVLQSVENMRQAFNDKTSPIILR